MGLCDNDNDHRPRQRESLRGQCGETLDGSVFPWELEVVVSVLAHWTAGGEDKRPDGTWHLPSGLQRWSSLPHKQTEKAASSPQWTDPEWHRAEVNGAAESPVFPQKHTRSQTQVPCPRYWLPLQTIPITDRTGWPSRLRLTQSDNEVSITGEDTTLK